MSVSSSDRSRAWYRRSLGVWFYAILGPVAVAALFATVLPVGGRTESKAAVLTVLFAALDVLMIVPIAWWVFRRGFLRVPRYPAADLVIALILFALAVAAFAIFMLFVCLNAAPAR